MPVQVSYPGVYIQEIPSGVHTIAPVATANTAFIGRTVMGPVNQALTLTSLGDYQRAFGAVTADSPVSQAVSDFYQNGGGTSIVVRLFNPDPSPAAYQANLQTATDAATAVDAAAAKSLEESKTGGKTSAEAQAAAVTAATPVAATYATNPGKAAAQQVLGLLKGFPTTADTDAMKKAADDAAAAVKTGADAVKAAVDKLATDKPTALQPEALQVAEDAAKSQTAEHAAMAASRLVLIVADLAPTRTSVEAKAAVDAAWTELVTNGADKVKTAADTGNKADEVRDKAAEAAATLTGEAAYGGKAVSEPLGALDLSIDVMKSQLADSVGPAAEKAVPQVTAVLVLGGSAPVTTVVNAGNAVATAAALAWLDGRSPDEVVKAAEDAATGLQTSGPLSSGAAQVVALAAVQAQSEEAAKPGSNDAGVALAVMKAAVGAVTAAVQQVLALPGSSPEVVQTRGAQSVLDAAWTAAPSGAMAVQKAADGVSNPGTAGAALVQSIDDEVDHNPTTVTARDVCTRAAAKAAADVSGALDKLTLQAASPGDWPNGVLSASVDYADITPEAVASLNLPSSLGTQDFFNLSVAYAPVVGAPASERFPMVSVNIDAGDHRLDRVLKVQSTLLAWTFMSAARPGDGATGTAEKGQPSQPLVVADYLGSQDARTGIYALETVDLFNLMSIPPDVPDSASGTPPRMSVYPVAAKYCQARRAFLIIDPPAQWTTYWNQGKPASIKIGDLGSYGPEGTNAAVYFPNLTAGRAPSGALAGIYARTDIARGVWKAPAGTADGGISGSGLQLSMTDAQNGMLNPQGINALRTFPAYGSVVWGARTLKGADAISSDWKYVPVRRLALYIEESLYRGTQWAVFEPNDEPLWAGLRLNVGSFMNNLFRQGAFQGKSASDAYYVRCDATTTTQNDINLGIVNVIVGFAPLKPAEFVILSIAQIAGKILT